MPLPAHACQIALALGLDVSSSVDAEEYALQRDGLAAALSAPQVRSLLFSGAGEVALAVYEWSGRNQQVMVLNWTRITGPVVLDEVIRKIGTARRSYFEFPTALGYALGFGAILLADAPQCDQRTLDISGDGVTNDGFGPVEAFRNFPFDGVTVNGLVVQTSDHRVPIYYRNEVIRGDGAFVELADGFADFERAMTRKLLRELGALAIGAVPEKQTESNG